MKLPLNPEYNLYEKGGKPYCDSLQVAESFAKRHDNVLRDIENLDCSNGFRLLNFEESSYKNEQNKKQPKARMTKEGFTFLVMGYRGKKAAAFKEAYITRFNPMELFLQSLLTTKIEFLALAEWKKLYEAGEKVNEAILRKRLNAIKHTEFPWMSEVTKCAPQLAIKDNLNKAFQNFFKGLKKE